MFNLAYVLELVVDCFDKIPFPEQNLVDRFISEFFMLFLSFVTRWMSSTKRDSKSSWLMYPLSANIFPKSLRVKSLSFSGSRSSVFPGVSVHWTISPRSFMTMCSLKP